MASDLDIFKIKIHEPDKEKQDSFENDLKIDFNSSQEKPQWPVKNPTKFLGEFGQGDKRHREGKSDEELKMYGGHRGTDVGAEKGTPAYPMLSGIVNRIYNWSKGDKATQGNMVVIDHPEFNVSTKYMHLDSINVSPGQKVTQNTEIGTVGNTGNAIGTYPHIHFELEKNKTSINARPYIEGQKELEKAAYTNRSIRTKIIKELFKTAKFWEDED